MDWGEKNHEGEEGKKTSGGKKKKGALWGKGRKETPASSHALLEKIQEKIGGVRSSRNLVRCSRSEGKKGTSGGGRKGEKQGGQCW